VGLPAWIPRRAECGTPCQTCRHRCEYQAIATSGTVDYAECFQCLDCVAIHQDAKRCMPLIREHKRRVIPLRPVPVTA
jgi:polyferredoxin